MLYLITYERGDEPFHLTGICTSLEEAQKHVDRYAHILKNYDNTAWKKQFWRPTKTVVWTNSFDYEALDPYNDYAEVTRQFIAQIWEMPKLGTAPFAVGMALDPKDDRPVLIDYDQIIPEDIQTRIYYSGNEIEDGEEYY